MKLVDRYLAAIGRELPLRQADEITAELRDVLLSKIEDRESELGRPMTDKEIEKLLIDFGHPLIVAGSYRRTQYLIGPELFPMWIATMRFILTFGGAIALISLVVAAAGTDASPASILQRVGENFWPALLEVFATVTLVFAVNERMGRYRFKLAFNPRHLPAPRARSRQPAQIVSDMVVGAAALAWWAGLIHVRALMPIPSFIEVHLASTWDAFRAPIAAYLAVQIAINGLALLRPGWGRLNLSLSLANYLAGCVLFGLILQAGHWIELTAPTRPGAALAGMQMRYDQGLRLGLMITLVTLAFKAGADVLRLWRSLGQDTGNGTSAATAAG